MNPLRNRWPTLLLLLGLAFSPLLESAAEPGRFALLIGNGAYPAVQKGANKFGPLRNPSQDVADMKALLREQNFKITEELLDAPTKDGMEAAIKRFVDGLPRHSVALVFYSGHGVEEDGVNYLLPARGFRNKVEVKDFALNANWVMHELAASQASGSILILDACRDHVPLDETKGAQNEGFAAMRMKGVLVAYATQAGKTAWGQPDQPNSLYTQHLIAAWRAKSREPVEMIFKETATRVADATHSLPEPQVPWYDPGLLGAPFCPDPLGCLNTTRPPELPQTGALTVRTQPPGATLRINGQTVGAVGEGGLPFDALNPGSYTLIATLAGYRELQRIIEIKAGVEKEVVLPLVPLQKVDELKVQGTGDAGGHRASTPELPNDQAAMAGPADSPAERATRRTGIPSGGERILRYIAYPDGTVLDTETELMWMRCSIGQNWNGKTCIGKAEKVTWEDSTKQTLDFAGYTDWRAPTIDELRTLIYCSNGKPEFFSLGKNSDGTGMGCDGAPNKDHDTPTVQKEVFPNTPGEFYLSSTLYNHNTENYIVYGYRAFGVFFDYGADNHGYTYYVKDTINNTRFGRLRLVRNP